MSTDFRRLSDWYGFTDLQTRLPLLEKRFKEARALRLSFKRDVAAYKARKERVPQHLEDSYNGASWAWQRAYAAYTQARKVYRELCEQYPEWN